MIGKLSVEREKGTTPHLSVRLSGVQQIFLEAHLLPKTRHAEICFSIIAIDKNAGTAGRWETSARHEVVKSPSPFLDGSPDLELGASSPVPGSGDDTP